MKFYRLTAFIAVIALLFITTGTMAQNTYQLLDESTMQITGTSTIHDWEADVQEVNLSANLGDDISPVQAPANAGFINSLTVTVPVKEIESGKGGMNKKIYDALKQKEHPTIRYQYTGGEIVSRDTTACTFTINATGDLTIAGVTKTVSFPVEGSYNEAGNLTFSGTYTLNMKEYNIDPPTAVFGTIKSGEVVTIAFDIALKKNTVANK